MAITKEIFRQRTYQLPSRSARAAGCKRFVKLWHRRAGKDTDAIIFALPEMLTRVGVYFHVYPSLNQGRRDNWNNIIHIREIDGTERAFKMPFLIPNELVAPGGRNESDMRVTLINGSIYQIMGADDDDAVDRLRGPNPVGLIWSEYAHGAKMAKAADTLSPVLAENGGWEQYAYTPNGLNHGQELWEMACKNPKWFAQKLTIDDTRRDALGEDGSPVISLAEIEDLRQRGQREEFIQQEYWCSFTGFMHGTIYGDLMQRARSEGRISTIPYLVNQPVGVCLDLGHSDAMAVWFYQIVNDAVRFIDYWEDTQKDIKDVVRMLRQEKPYLYGRVVLPWDGRSAANYLEEVGFQNVHVCDRTPSLQAEIETVRREFSRFYFDEHKCAIGINGLTQYKRKYDEELRVFSAKPVHDEHSHRADALRTGVSGGFHPLMFDSRFGSMGSEIKVEMDFDPRVVAGRANDIFV